uniref:Uncharacterized protein n=1 Tax=Vitis vinifera TaxID=29760 RepID=A5BF26_VITVI|nr:hypothetical protein VITISV_043027 [Vitis vinifera]
MTLTRAFEKLRDGGLIVPLAPRPLPHPIPPHFRSHEHCLYHQIQGHDTERCSALHHAIQDLIDSGLVNLAGLNVTTNPLPTHSTHAVPLPPEYIDGYHRASVGAFTRFQRSCYDFVGRVPIFGIDHFSIRTSCLLIRCDHSFIITFRVGTPRFGTHDVFYALHFMHEGYGDYIIGIFEPSFLSFLSPYYLGLRYVLCLKTTLRPLLYIVFDNSHVGNTRAWSKIIPRSMMDGELR